jgi:hypothetical protein
MVAMIGATGQVAAINRKPAVAASTNANDTHVTTTGSLRYQRFRVSAMPAFYLGGRRAGKLKGMRETPARCNCGSTAD